MDRFNEQLAEVLDELSLRLSQYCGTVNQIRSNMDYSWTFLNPFWKHLFWKEAFYVE